MSKWTVDANADTIATIECHYPVQFWPERTCRVERRHVGPLYNVYKFSCCEEEWAESNTDQHASAIDETVCPRCGAKVIE